jgi:Na+/melibiose symporter-like transporter
MNDSSLEAAAHMVQLALTPVFLLSATATLLGVFAARLARVADRVDTLSKEEKEPIRDELLALLRRRSRVLDVAVVLAALAGGLTCASVLVLFLAEVRGTAAAKLLFLLFGSAIILVMASLSAFVTEMLLATRGVRRTVDMSAPA